MSINERIDLIINEKKLNNTSFGEILGVTEATIRRFRNEGDIKDIYLEILSVKFGYNIEWLKHGKGEKFKLSTDLDNSIVRKLTKSEENKLAEEFVIHREQMVLNHKVRPIIEKEAYKILIEDHEEFVLWKLNIKNKKK